MTARSASCTQRQILWSSTSQPACRWCPQSIMSLSHVWPAQHRCGCSATLHSFSECMSLCSYGVVGVSPCLLWQEHGILIRLRPVSCVDQALGETCPLLSTHRLDTCTEGLVVLGRKREFVAAFNKLLGQPGALKKYYRALTKEPPPTGTPSN